MNSLSHSDVAAELLLMSLLSVLVIGVGLAFTMARVLKLRKERQRAAASAQEQIEIPEFQPSVFENSGRWLAIRSSNPVAAQTALGLHNVKRHGWPDAIEKLGDNALFISPPVDGWLLVVGEGLPDPADDVDKCFRFILKASRELGHVQYFSVNHATNHHAWVKAEGDQIIRAYAWAGQTVWNQGRLTIGEKDLAMHCLDYGEDTPGPLLSHESITANADKVFLLAARWSIDPNGIDPRRIGDNQGITGELTQV